MPSDGYDVYFSVMVPGLRGSDTDYYRGSVLATVSGR